MLRTSTKTELNKRASKYLTETKCRDLILRSRVFGLARRGEGHRTASRKTEREFYWEGTPHGSILPKNSLGFPRSLWRVCAHTYEPTRPQANTRTLLFREIATRPRRFKRLPNEVWLRKHGTYTRMRGALTRREERATPLSITPRATKQIKRMNTRGYSGAFPTGGMQPVEYLQPENYFFVRRDYWIF